MKLNDVLLPETKKVFYGWLQQQGALDKYKANLKERYATNVREYDGQILPQFINVSFIWDRTPQQHSYWSNLHKKWQSYIIGYIKTHSKFRKWASENNMRLTYSA